MSMFVPTEIWRAALALVESYGPAASGHAALQAAEHFVRGDAEGTVAWQKIVDAIVVLQSEKPARGETIH
jgi:hypothetical protein